MNVYYEIDLKKIYADLIEQIGHDAGAVCKWNGVDSISLEDWKKAWWEEFRSYTQYEQEHGAYHERERIIKELTKLNQCLPCGQGESLKPPQGELP